MISLLCYCSSIFRHCWTYSFIFKTRYLAINTFILFGYIVKWISMKKSKRCQPDGFWMEIFRRIFCYCTVELDFVQQFQSNVILLVDLNSYEWLVFRAVNFVHSFGLSVHIEEYLCERNIWVTSKVFWDFLTNTYMNNEI